MTNDGTPKQFRVVTNVAPDEVEEVLNSMYQEGYSECKRVKMVSHSEGSTFVSFQLEFELDAVRFMDPRQQKLFSGARARQDA